MCNTTKESDRFLNEIMLISVLPYFVFCLITLIVLLAGGD